MYQTKTTTPLPKSENTQVTYEREIRRLEQLVVDLEKRVRFLERENNRRRGDVTSIASAINRG